MFRIAHQVFHGETMVCEGFELRAWALSDEASDTGFKAAAIPDEFRNLFDG